ncbi:TIGR03087 family PEP-CTERM/XrtA system glycosyltransferase [Altererythrobacter sp.]|uniref:TIGR03087 family PEP-CTERM/XrtA system glycosyltransferase n=1 Tax=Altererythrobacter sp. TaxID=1872480 RepID=UPI003D12D6BE
MGEILFLAHRIPFPPDRGDKIRAHHLLKHLAELGPVHVGCFAETDRDIAAESELSEVAASHSVTRRSKPLALAGAEAVLSGKPVSLTAFHSRALQLWVSRTMAERPIETIVIFSGQMGQYIPNEFAGRVILDLCDVDSVKFEDYAAAGERVWLNRREGRLLAVEEERLTHRSDATILISENEKSLLQSRLRDAAGKRIHAIGNGIDAEFFNPDMVQANREISARPGPHFVFTGQMDYRPNEQAAVWAIEHFLPAIRAVEPQAEFHIVGRNPTPALLTHSDTPGLTIWGEVPDVRPFLAAADMALVPLSIARGVQNKVLEAMAMGLPVMLSPQAATGISARDGEHWLVEALDAEAMVKRFQTFRTEGRGEAIGPAARRFALEHHSWPAVLAPLTELVLPQAEKRNAA